MTYYRIAGRLRSAPTWHWRTSKVGSLQAVWLLLERYRWPEHSHLRVFVASSVAGLDEMLARANAGQASTSVPAERVVRGQPLPTWDLAEAEDAEEREQRSHAVTEGARAVVENAKPSWAAATSLQPLDRRRLELELGAGGDHDTPYCFAWPTFWPEALAWIRLRTCRQPGNEALGMERPPSQGQKLARDGERMLRDPLAVGI